MPKFTNRTGEIHRTNNYGDITITEYNGCRDATVKFHNTGNIRTGVQYSAIRTGNVTDSDVIASRLGEVHVTNNYGDITITEYNGSMDVTVRFHNTGTIRSGLPYGSILNGNVVDQETTPKALAMGKIYPNNQHLSETMYDFISGIYQGQKQRSPSRGHAQPGYDLSWLIDFCMSNGFVSLYDAYMASGGPYVVLNAGGNPLAPSIDRLDNTIGYTPSNIQLVTWGENMANGYRDASIPVTSIDGDGNEINHPSISEASRVTGINITTLRNSIDQNRTVTGLFDQGAYRFRSKINL